RLWPRRFTDWMKELTGNEINRFVISTHTLALASSLLNVSALSDAWKNQAKAADGVVLPRKLVTNLEGDNYFIAKGIPSLLETLKETDSAGDLEGELTRIAGGKPEAYYAMLYMDGDKMGAWLADSWGMDDNKNRLQYAQTWHPLVVDKLRKSFADDSA